MRFHNGLELNRIGLNPPLRHHEAQEFTRTDYEHTLEAIEFHTVHVQQLKSFFASALYDRGILWY